MGIYIKGVSIPKDRDMEIIVHPDGAARVEVKEDYGLHLIGTDAINIEENRKNWDCYWAHEETVYVNGKDFPKIYCRFNGYDSCEPCEICKYYVRHDKIDDYIKHLLEEIEILTKLP